MRRDQITIPLGIPDIQVVETAVNERGEIIITIESIKNGTRCRKCGKWISKAHGQDDWVMIRHLPAFWTTDLFALSSKTLPMSGLRRTSDHHANAGLARVQQSA